MAENHYRDNDAGGNDASSSAAISIDRQDPNRTHSRNDDDRNGNADGAQSTSKPLSIPYGSSSRPSAASAAAPQSQSDMVAHDVPLVELSLENITYAPVTRTASSSSSGGCLSRLRGGGDSSSKSRRSVLADVTTTISPYRLSAWMGPSGSGKTSLISVAAGLLSDPTNDLINETTIRINGETGTLPKRLVGVVWQEDLLLSNLTVRETIRFAARLKTPESTPNDQVDRIVDETISELGLDGVKDSLVGEPHGKGSRRGISGGERKRVAVAAELVGRPSVLLLDEPTSGLDATTAYRLMVTLKELAGRGHAIAVVVHQPRTSIFDLFDNLLLLSKGRAVYEGHPSGVRGFLESCPGVGELPPETGKADWIMDVIIEDETGGTTKEGVGGGGPRLPSLWDEERERRRQRQEEEEGAVPQSRDKLLSGDDTSSTPGRRSRRLSTLSELASEIPKFQTSKRTQLQLLTQRALRQQRGDRITRTAILITAFWILLTSLAWGHLPDNTSYVFNRASLLFFVIIAQSNSIVVSSMTLFAKERALLSRERAKKMYGVLPYFVAKTFSDMINSVALPLVYGATVYWITNLRPTAGAYATFLLILYLTVSAAQSTGLFLSMAIPQFDIALMLAPLITIILMILGGFYIPLDSINPALRWASWVSMATYGFAAFLVNEFDGRDVPCDDSIDVGDEGGGGGGKGISLGNDQCPLPGSTVLAGFGIDVEDDGFLLANIWANVGILIAMQVFLRVATYVLLLRSK